MATVTSMVLVGCASFSGNTLPPAPAYPDVELDRKPSLSVQVEFRQFMNGTPVTLFRGTAERSHAKRLAKILEESSYFSSVSVGTDAADLTLDVKLRDEGSGSMGMAVLTGLTLYLVPSFATDTWIAEATVTVPATGRAEDFHVEEFVTQWQQIFLLPVMPFKSTPMVNSQVQGQIWKTLVGEIAASGLIEEAAVR